VAPVDLRWALERVVRMEAVARWNAEQLGPRLLTGDGDPDAAIAAMHDAQDALALATLLTLLRIPLEDQ
jgi:hypothetical protein